MSKQTIRAHVLESYEKSTINDIAQHGCGGGSAPGLIYYDDTVNFYDEHHEEIWDFLYEDAEDQGLTIPELIASFNGAKNVGSEDQHKNLLVWYAVERVCQQLINENDDAA